ncbi:hypothetical protein BV20DRAFT_1044223 [Pilatotrama ljubarskyi]|nr:hypothetical protein BV20DRAFT_1044223 [Pilatotrama ljubarskyi]
MPISDSPPANAPDGIPFAFFVELVQAIGAIKPHKATQKQPRNTRYVDTPAYKTFKRWLAALRERYSPLPSSVTSILFCMFFPEEDVRRKYGMQETRLAQYLCKILGVSSSSDGRGERLRHWKGEDHLGCLGDEVETVMSASFTPRTGCATLMDVESLLDELAGTCAFSADSVRNTSTTRRSREAILTELYTSLTPSECAVVTQIILKDLRPLLYPIPRSASHYTSALLDYKSNAVAMLTKEAAMHAWDPSGRMSLIFKTRANLEDAARAYEGFASGEGLPQPTVGMPIQIPKCVKGQGPAHSLKALASADKVWVETKYDGERAQIHVWLDDDGAPHIRIFSKSGRDSTLDRAGVHSVIYEALGLTDPHQQLDEEEKSPSSELCFNKSIIVEAEMVAYSDVLDRIDEFWRIRSLIASAAIGVRHKSPPPPPSSTQEDVMDTQCSLISDGSDGDTRHLALVFFDILLLNGVSLLSLPYGQRRAVLERAIRKKPGYAMLAERTCIDMKSKDPAEELRRVFARVIANHQEGIVIKAGGATYAERRWPWVKVKQDYIPGYGDSVDLVLLAASWEKERARELRVPPTAYTTFYFGALANADELRTHPTRLPHFEIIFTSSYGLDREQLEELNFMIKSSDPVPYGQCAIAGLSYTHKLCPSLSPPTVLVRQPLLAELFGAGFTKAPRNMFYELRFPRIAKIYRPSDRPWIDGTTFSELQQIARAAVGRDRPGKAEDDWARAMFRPDEPPSPGVHCPVKRKRTEELWVQRLAVVDSKVSWRSATKKARLEGATGNTATRDPGDAENAPSVSMSIGSPRQRTGAGMSRLGSMTNLTHSPPLDLPLFTRSPLSTSSDKDACLPGPSNRQATPESQPAEVHRSTSSYHAPPVFRPPAQAASAPCAELIAPHSHTAPAAAVPPSANNPSDSDVNAVMQPPTSLTIHEFLQTSVAFLSRSYDSPRPAWRAPSHTVIPLGSKVHSLDCLLRACGWGKSASCDWAARGVIFVDDDSEWVCNMVNEMTSARMLDLLGVESGPPVCKPVFIMSTRVLAHDALAHTATLEEWERRAICRFG